MDVEDYEWHTRHIVMEICQRVGLPLDAFNPWQLTKYCKGISTTNKHSAASVLELLGDHFLFDPTNYGGVVHFVPRGKDPVLHITTEQLVDKDGREIERKARKDGISVPKVIHLEYFDLDGGLTPDKQTSDRGASPQLRNKAEGVTQSTIIMTADEAAQAVVISHKISIEEQRGEVKFHLADNFIQLVCADIITLNGERLRIIAIEIDEGVQTYTAIHDRVSAYESKIKGLPIELPSEPPSLIISETVLEILDIPIIASSDDALGYYVNTCSKTFNWTGAVVEISKDGGATWLDSDNTNVNGTMGKLRASIPAHNHNYPDRHNVLTVELVRKDMELPIATMREMMNRTNLAIIGNELINFSQADQISDDTWELRGLLRGRKGTPAIAHSAGERFVLLNTLTFIDAELFELNKGLTFRATSFGTEPGADKQTILYTGQSQRERRPAYLKARRVGGDLKVSWQGVGRLGGGMNIGMGAYFTGYRITLNSNVVNTNEMTATIPYSAGTLMVQQVNQITGPGPAATLVIT